MIYYNPDVNKAYANVEDFRYIVPFGVLIRNMHRWTAHLMVMFVSLHMLRVFLTGAYKPPRELNWIVGVILLVFTMLSSFTGYLLPWDQLAYWGVTIGCSMGENAPLNRLFREGALLHVKDKILIMWAAQPLCRLPK